MGKNILVVDDFASTRKVIGASLQKLGFEVYEAENGEDAKRFFDGRNIDLVVSDLNMPIVDGIELSRHIRSTNTYFKVPILMLTTEIKKEKKDSALSAGVTAILNKPYSSDMFNKLINKLLNI